MAGSQDLDLYPLVWAKHCRAGISSSFQSKWNLNARVTALTERANGVYDYCSMSKDALKPRPHSTTKGSSEVIETPSITDGGQIQGKLLAKNVNRASRLMTNIGISTMQEKDFS